MGLMDKLKIQDPSVDENEVETGQEFQTEYQQDPVPDTSKKTSTPKPAPKRLTSKTATNKLAKEVGDDLATMLEMGAVVWGMRDQCCAPVLAEQAQPIGESIAAILARNPRLLEKFANTDIAVYTVQLLALGRALAPVGGAIYHNHVSKATKNGEHPRGNNAINLNEFPAYNGNQPQYSDFGRD
jgi:hypothetical protein